MAKAPKKEVVVKLKPGEKPPGPVKHLSTKPQQKSNPDAIKPQQLSATKPATTAEMTAANQKNGVKTPEKKPADFSKTKEFLAKKKAEQVAADQAAANSPEAKALAEQLEEKKHNNTIRIACQGSGVEKLDNLVPFQGDLKSLSEENYKRLRELILKNGFSAPIFRWQSPDGNRYILDGHQRTRTLQRMREEGFTIPEIPVADIQAETHQEAKEKLLSFASNFGVIELQGLRDFAVDAGIGFDRVMSDFHFSGVNMEEFNLKFVTEEPGGNGGGDHPGALRDRFVVPPFSVLDTRQGYWQDRKKAWMDEIQDQGESREGTLSKSELMGAINSGVSILDPVLAEAMATWFTTPQCNVLDPFAGDTVFGYVAKKLGHKFVGIELREEQAKLNQARCDQLDVMGDLPGTAVYVNDTSENIDAHVEDNSMDFLFSCPPYYDLEVYSDLPEDLSTFETYEKFRDTIGQILTKSVAKLRKNRFACIVITELRAPEKNGSYRHFVPDMIDIMCKAGMVYYNELILLNAIGTAHMRANRYMAARKTARIHQNILVFYKGDPATIPDVFPKFEITYKETGLEDQGTVNDETLLSDTQD